jgi:Flp pilus assembly pilin Flp
MQRIVAHSDRLIRNTAGTTVLEYAFIAGIISIAAIALWATIGGWVNGVFGTLASAL